MQKLEATITDVDALVSNLQLCAQPRDLRPEIANLLPLVLFLDASILRNLQKIDVHQRKVGLGIALGLFVLGVLRNVVEKRGLRYVARRG